jgi:hypothetical protein
VQSLEHIISFSLWGDNLATLVHITDIEIPVREIKVWNTNLQCVSTTTTEEPIKALYPWSKDVIACWYLVLSFVLLKVIGQKMAMYG